MDEREARDDGDFPSGWLLWAAMAESAVAGLVIALIGIGLAWGAIELVREVWR